MLAKVNLLKIVFLVALVAIAAGAEAQSVKVISPNGGETLTIGSPFRLKWQAAPKTGLVKLQWQNGTSTTGTIAIVDSTKGFYDWTPSLVTVKPSSVYSLVVSSTAMASITDASDKPFTLQAPTSTPTLIKVLSPLRNAPWIRGELKAITWEASSTPAIMQIKVRAINVASGKVTEIINRAPNTGTVNWRVGQTLDGSKLPAGQYRLRACLTTDPTSCEQASGEGAFELKEPAPAPTRGLGALIWEALVNLFTF